MKLGVDSLADDVVGGRDSNWKFWIRDTGIMWKSPGWERAGVSGIMGVGGVGAVLIATRFVMVSAVKTVPSSVDDAGGAVVTRILYHYTVNTGL